MRHFLRIALIVGPLPVTLINGTTADATQVMSDLNWIVNQVNANAAPLATTAVTNANNNFTTVQSGQPATQPGNFPIALQVQNVAFNTLSSVLGTNTITARVSALTLSAYGTGQVFTFVASNNNTGAATLNVDGVGARSILSMGSALTGAELRAGQTSIVGFNGVENAFDLLNASPYVRGPNIPAAATLNLDANFGDYAQVDGIATITAMTLSPGRHKLLEFTSSPQISNGASLILGSNVVPAVGDVWGFRGEAGGIVRATSMLASGPRYLSNSLSSDVALNNTAVFFDGPTINNPLGGMWLVNACVTTQTTVGATVLAKLWDGFNVFASTKTNTFGATIALTGICTNARGPIRISLQDSARTDTLVKWNLSGLGADSVITAIKIG